MHIEPERAPHPFVKTMAQFTSRFTDQIPSQRNDPVVAEICVTKYGKTVQISVEDGEIIVA